MSQPGFVQAFTDFTSNALQHASSRLRLLGLEIAEERERVISLLIAALMSCFFVSLAVVFGALLVVAHFWDSPHRMAAIGWIALGSLALAVIGVLYFWIRVHKPTALFSHSLAEFEKDQHALERGE